jgi:hypothetical protein
MHFIYVGCLYLKQKNIQKASQEKYDLQRWILDPVACIQSNFYPVELEEFDLSLSIHQIKTHKEFIVVSIRQVRPAFAF